MLEPLNRLPPALTAPASAYWVNGQTFDVDAPGLAEAIAAGFAERHATQGTHIRPCCLCKRDDRGQGIEMYVAKLGDGLIVKRIPNTGDQHASHCPHFEPAAELSGLGQVRGSAISEDPATGATSLKLDFALTKIAGRSNVPTAGGASDSVKTDGSRLSLRALLHYLWDQAELTRWHPGFEGKRSWATVRKQLLNASQNLFTRGEALLCRLHIPEVFSVDQRDAINARRVAQFADLAAKAGTPQRLMLLVAEVKEIVPARYGFKAVIKHVPDQAFMLDEQLYRRMGRRFESELALWGAADNLHMVMIATFAVSEVGVPTVVELSLMPVTQRWLPVQDAFEAQWIDRLVRAQRSFIKILGYNTQLQQGDASVVLTDTGTEATTLRIAPRVDAATDSAEGSVISHVHLRDKTPFQTLNQKP
jgi:Protein of unknown function (DUF1173)